MGTLARFFSSDVGFELVKPVRIHAERELFLELDYEALKARADIPDLFAALELAPAEAMPCVRAAVHEVIHNSPIGRKELPHLQVSPAAAKVITRPPRVDVHLYNHPEVQIKFSELKSKTIGKLVSIRGHGHESGESHALREVADVYVRQVRCLAGLCISWTVSTRSRRVVCRSGVQGKEVHREPREREARGLAEDQNPRALP